MKDYKVWTCKVVVPGDVEIPRGFDTPPRVAAERAILDGLGLDRTIAIFSGWGGSLSPEVICIEDGTC